MRQQLQQLATVISLALARCRPHTLLLTYLSRPVSLHVARGTSDRHVDSLRCWNVLALSFPRRQLITALTYDRRTRTSASKNRGKTYYVAFRLFSFDSNYSVNGLLAFHLARNLLTEFTSAMEIIRPTSCILFLPPTRRRLYFHPCLVCLVIRLTLKQLMKIFYSPWIKKKIRSSWNFMKSYGMFGHSPGTRLLYFEWPWPKI